MIESAFLFVGVVALVWTLATLAAAVVANNGNPAADALASNAGVVGFVLWGVWTFGSLNIEVANGTTVYTFTHPELALVGIVMALVCGYVAITGPLDLIYRAMASPGQRDL